MKNNKGKPESDPETTDDDDSVYDSGDDAFPDDAYDEDEEEADDDSDNDQSDADDEDEFEDQGSSDDDDDLLEDQQDDDESVDGGLNAIENIDEAYESVPRKWNVSDHKVRESKRTSRGTTKSNDELTTKKDDKIKESLWMHTDDLSSDDEDEGGTSNRIGKVPLHWYDEYDHIGYDVHGQKVVKSSKPGEGGGDRIDQAIALSDDKEKNKFTVHDALNDRNVTLTERQIELIRRVQGGSYAHPEFQGNPDYIDYFSGVNKEISGLNSNRDEPKHRFQPSRWEALQVRRLINKLEKGHINMDYLKGKVRDMNDVKRKTKNPEDDPEKTFLLWKGDEEDELSLRKGPQHIAAPKLPPPGHAESYIPPDEYLPTEQDLKEWEEMDVKDRPHGLLIPKKFPNLRSVGAYEHSVREAFERCLDLYLCPRMMKRRLNIDPESLIPKLPKASDLRPFPTAKCIEYKTPHDDDAGPPIIRCVSPSPDGQFLASGASDGYVRLWEVQTGRLLQSWNVSQVISLFDNTEEDGNINGDDDAKATSGGIPKPIVSLEWNPNRYHHCLLVAVGKCAVIIATGTGGSQDAEITEALLSEACSFKGNDTTSEAKAVTWIPIIKDKEFSECNRKGSAVSSFCKGISSSGPICALRANREMTSVRWHKKGDYFVTISPKAGAAAVLIHQLSKTKSQQPFRKFKGGEVQLACFHPNKPFLFVSSQQHVRVYHLVKQTMVKRLISGCRWISSIDVHPTGDHLIVGSLDRRMIWFDLDLSNTPYKTLKYHERALRSVGYHARYPLMASASDDGVVHVFHSMVYSDLMRNPLLVPVKILRGHTVHKKLGVLTLSFHPTQPWLFTGGADGRIFLFQDI